MTEESFKIKVHSLMGAVGLLCALCSLQFNLLFDIVGATHNRTNLQYIVLWFCFMILCAILIALFKQAKKDYFEIINSGGKR